MREHGIAHHRSGHKDALRVGDVVGGPSEGLIPAGGEFVANAGLESEIVPQPDGIFDVPRAEEASPAQFRVEGHDLKRLVRRSLQERRQAGKGGLPSWREALSSLS